LAPKNALIILNAFFHVANLRILDTDVKIYDHSYSIILKTFFHKKYTFLHMHKVKNSSQVVIFVSNRGYALSSSRKNLIHNFIKKGWIVVLATTDDPESRSLTRLGAKLEPISFYRGGLSLLADINSVGRLAEIYRRWRPNLIHHFHAKPVIFGTLISHFILGKTVCVINVITGLGHAFINRSLAAQLAGLGYAIGVPHSDIVIFQNRDDRRMFLRRNWVRPEQARIIVSSGVDLNRFTFISRKDRNPNNLMVVMIGRLITQKGVMEFIEVARRIRLRWPATRFLWAGEEELVHPDAVNTRWFSEQYSINYLGRLSDVVPLLNDADLLLFPSFYREGVPRVILEAAATGLPTVAFDVPGVREAVIDCKTGYLVPDRDIDAMTERVETLLTQTQLRLRMGQAARKMAENSFDFRIIEQQYISAYHELGVNV
jgi:glycosyltransferase involved in cell wall biosynthesis